MDYTHKLVAIGLTTKDQESFGNIQMSVRKASIRRAYCSSMWCAPRCSKTGDLKDANKYIEKPFANPNESQCRDCGCCLFWECR